MINWFFCLAHSLFSKHPSQRQVLPIGSRIQIVQLWVTPKYWSSTFLRQARWGTYLTLVFESNLWVNFWTGKLYLKVGHSNSILKLQVPHPKQQHRRLLSFGSPVSCESAWLADSSCGPGNAATERTTTLYALGETTHRIQCKLWWVVSPRSWLVYHTITSFWQNSSWVTQQLFRCGKLQTLDTISKTT